MTPQTPTLFHAPWSRSTGILAAIREFSLDVTVEPVTIRRPDGSGGPDPRNPHPEKKSPALLAGGDVVTERGAILLHLTDLFPKAGLGPCVGEAGRGAYGTWLVWYQSVLEPALILDMAKVEPTPELANYFDLRMIGARLSAALAKGPWLLGARFSAADLLIASTFEFLPHLTPDDPAVRDWVRRTMARPGVKAAGEEDKAAAGTAAA